MNTQEKIKQEIEHLPEIMLSEILTFIQKLKNKPNSQYAESEIWQAYLESKDEREEVYRRLANS